MKPDAVPDVGTVDDEPALELPPDNVPCVGGGVVVVLDVGDVLNGALVVGAVVCAADVLGAAVVDLAAAWVVELELEAHDVEEAFGCVCAGALLLDVELGGSVLGSLVLGFVLTLVLKPPPGLKLLLPVSGLVGVTSGVGGGLDELEEEAGLDFTETGTDELVLAAGGVDETDPVG